MALQEVPIATAPEVVDELLGPGLHVRGFTRAAKDGVGAALATRWPHRVVEEIDQRCSPCSLEFDWCATLLGELDASIGRTLFAHHKPSWQFGYEWERNSRHSPLPGHGASRRQRLLSGRVGNRAADRAGFTRRIRSCAPRGRAPLSHGTSTTS